MKIVNKKPTATMALVFIAITSSAFAVADTPKDCLLEGTVVHKENAGQETTMVQIHSVSKYNDSSTCHVRRGQKLEFKLPHDSRVKAAPSGSDVQYRYQSDEAGQGRTDVIMVGT